MRSSNVVPLALALALAAGALSGCGKSGDAVSPLAPGGPASNSDQAEIASVLASVPEVVDESAFATADETSLGGGPAGATAAIEPLRFWRTITEVERHYDFQFSDPDPNGMPTTAIVTLDKVLSGSFNILTGPAAVNLTDANLRNVVRKPLRDDWRRRLLLKRVPDLRPELRPRWRVAAISGVKVTSRVPAAVPHTRILSLRIQSGPQDTTVTDPLQFFRLRRVLQLQPRESVMLTVTTESDNDVVVLLHAGLRFPFVNNGDNTYSAKWAMPGPGMGVRHLGVNALSKGTLYDDQAPYNSDAWILPYAMPPTMLAEYMP